MLQICRLCRQCIEKEEENVLRSAYLEHLRRRMWHRLIPRPFKVSTVSQWRNQNYGSWGTAMDTLKFIQCENIYRNMLLLNWATDMSDESCCERKAQLCELRYPTAQVEQWKVMESVSGGLFFRKCLFAASWSIRLSSKRCTALRHMERYMLSCPLPGFPACQMLVCHTDSAWSSDCLCSVWVVHQDV